MLDVHPPHSPTHTWTDFFIHVGTICVGLLIAVGLEQTVEYFHRQHERHLLEHELHAEAEILQRNAEIDIVQYDARLKNLLAQRKDLNLMIAGQAKTALPPRLYIAPPRGHGVEGAGYMTILNPIWESARADGRVALLPEGLKRAYGVVSYREGLWAARNLEAQEAVAKFNSFAYQFSDFRTPSTPAFSHWSEAQLVELRALVTDAFERLRTLRSVTIDLAGELNLVLREAAVDQQALTPADLKVEAEYHAAHPEDFARMADEIDAEDAARGTSPARSAGK